MKGIKDQAMIKIKKHIELSSPLSQLEEGKYKAETYIQIFCEHF